MDHEKKGLGLAILLLLILTLFILTTDWMLYHSLLPTEGDILWAIINAISKLYDRLLLIRGSYAGMLIAFAAFYSYSKETASNRRKVVLSVLTCLVLILFFIGYTSNYVYSYFAYPVISLAMTVLIPMTLKAFRISAVKSDDSLFGLGRKKGDEFEVSIGTDQGPLYIHNPRQGIQVTGGAGSGKSASVIIPLIVQFIQKGYAGFLYDFEGNPMEKGSPLLGTIAYTALKQLPPPKLNGPAPVQFAFINFNDMSKTHRCNPIAPRYINSYNFINELADMLMKNLNPEWRTKADFWAENAISFLSCIIFFQYKNHPDKCTLAHVVAIMLSDWKEILEMLVTDPEIAPRMQPLYTAYVEDAGNQVAGVVSSTQLPLSKLFNPEVFWVLSKDDISLDITNEKHPTVLCVGNDPETYQVLSAPISVITGVVMNQMNQMNKRKSFFMCDELPTVYINRLDHLPATGRKKGICTVLAFQDESQLERDYGKDNAQVIQGNLGNIFCGMTNNLKTAENFVKMLGETKKHDQSFSNNSETASVQVTDSLKKEKVLEARDIMSQPTGQFTGKIAGSDKQFFRAQLDYFQFPPDTIPHFAHKIDESDPDSAQSANELVLFHKRTKVTIDLQSEINKFHEYQTSDDPRPPLLGTLTVSDVDLLDETLKSLKIDTQSSLQQLYDLILYKVHSITLKPFKQWLLELEVIANYEHIIEDVKNQLLFYQVDSE